MVGDGASKVCTVRFPKGLHARPSAMLVQVASRYASRLTVRLGDRTVSLKSLLGVLTLAAPPGARLLVQAAGSDAEAALAAIEQFFETTSVDV